MVVCHHSWPAVLRLLLLIVSTKTSPCDGASSHLRREQAGDIYEDQAERNADAVLGLLELEEMDMAHHNLRELKKVHAEKDGDGGQVIEDQWHMIGCDRGGGDNQNMNFFQRNFGSCSTVDYCIAAAMPVTMAYYCPKKFRPYCGGRCVSLLNGQCTDGTVWDKQGGRHSFLKDSKFWDREVSVFGFGYNRPFWPYNFGGESCAYDYSTAFSREEKTPMPTPRPTIRPSPMPTSSQTPRPTTLRPTPAPTPSPEFVLTEEKLKNCQYLALLGRTSSLGLENICNTSPDARATCLKTCQGQCDPFPSLHDITVQSTSCQSEANRMYVHKEEVVKNCEWLSGQENRGTICDESNERALKACPRVCIENNAEDEEGDTDSSADDEVKNIADEGNAAGSEDSEEDEDEISNDSHDEGR